ncbi:MAG: UDP-2,3-diacylglucosamine diphosphatase [Steroidobacteraceae bacterium]
MVGVTGADRQSFRSVFISDVHLGSRVCRATALREFLRSVRCETLVLVGDIVDLWSLKRSFYWPDSHSDVLRAIVDRAREGVRVVFVPGNHDHAFRALAGCVFSGVEIHREFLHVTADGRRMLVMHGDEFDGIVHCHPLIARLGVGIYDFVTDLNPFVDRVRGWFGRPPWSLAAALAQANPRARRYLQNYEEAAIATARHREVDGIICGHIHHAAKKSANGVLYCNTGDWVGSCTALTESQDGAFALASGLPQVAPLRAPSAIPARAA